MFSVNEFISQMRFQPVFIGAATVLLLYLLARQMYGKKTAIISSLLLCFLPWHIIQSRIMGAVIWVPFFGCLIFLSLFKAEKAIREKRGILAILWFLLSCLFLIKSLSTYESAMLFIPIFIVSLVFLYFDKQIKNSISLKIFCLLILIVFLFLSPMILKISFMKNEFWERFFRLYHKNIFNAGFFVNLFENMRNNLVFALNELFFSFKGASLLYGIALKAPLLISPVTVILFLISLVRSFFVRKRADKVLLIWLTLGFFGAIMGVNNFQARYVFIILPPLLILISQAIAWVFSKIRSPGDSFNRTSLLIIASALFLGLITIEVIQWGNYYCAAPLDFEECRHNSYGSKEAARYLSQLPNIKNHEIITDDRMTVDVYLNYYLWSEGKINEYYYFMTPLNGYGNENKGIIYVLWAPESHPKDYWDGLFRSVYDDSFRPQYPNESPIQTIYYPNGLAAIYIFKVLANDVQK